MDRCESCGAEFSCGTTEKASGCWCAELPPVLGLPADGSCLCPGCLKKEVGRRVGDCFGCRHSKTSTTKGGSAVFRCLRADVDPRFVKYPPLPLLGCAGRET